MGGFRFHDSLTGEVREFATVEPDVVRMYNCGPTVYADQQIGNYRNYICWDVLRRALELGGFKVRQIINITDVGHLTVDDVADAQGEDKLEGASRREQLDAWGIARKYEARYRADRAKLNMLEPERYPRATEHVPKMIAHVEELIRRGCAYVTPAGNVYFEVAKFPAYGRLSGNRVEALDAGSRVEVLDEKRAPADFALWKRDDKHQMQWDSPWGRGFPGWHIECSAMSRKYLGDEIDIHTGGEDNAFPHHECEIAQSEAVTGKKFVGTWMHCRHLLVDGAKMSKSKGTMYTLDDIEARGYSMRVLRYFLLSAHYRAPMNFTFQALDGARAAVEGLDNTVRNLTADWSATDRESIGQACKTVDDAFLAALQDDLNVSAALAAVHEFRVAVNSAGLVSTADTARIGRSIERIDSVLGLGLRLPPLSDPERAGERMVSAHAEIEALVADRESARKARDFAKADAIRKQIEGAGYVVEDRSSGPPRVYRK